MYETLSRRRMQMLLQYGDTRFKMNFLMKKSYYLPYVRQDSTWSLNFKLCNILFCDTRRHTVSYT